MANIAEPQVVINYISQLKKIIVNRVNQPSQLIIQTDYNLNEVINFQVINKINQIVQLDVNTTYQLYGTYIDAKKQVHILFYTLGVTPTNNVLSFLVNTYTSEYLAYVKNNRTPIDISIVAKQNVGGSTRSYMVLRDSALANPRGYIEGQAPTDIVYQNVFNSQIPVSTAFGAGNDINLAQDLEGQEIYSFAFGDTLSTNNANQFVIGYNNEPDATKAFIVANSGNIFTVDYEGNVEAGDLNVGAISATSITVSGEDLNQVIDDKVEYLSTSIDDKLSATENWVSDTFETKESVTQTFNELEGDIGQISAFVSGLPTNIAAKADQTDLEALSTTVEGLAQTKADLSAVQAVDNKFANYTPTETIVETYATKTSLEDYAKLSAIPTGNAQLQNTANYITSSQIPTSYVQLSQLDEYAKTAELSAYATSSWVDTNYAKKGEAPTDVYTKAEVNQISSALSSAVSGAGYLTEIPTSYVQKSELESVSGQLNTAIGAKANTTDVEAEFTATSAWANETFLTEHQSLSSYYTKSEVDTISSNIVNQIPTDAETYEAISGNIEAQITGKNYITSDALNGLASDEDLQYVSGVVSAQAEDITALKAVSGEVDYETVFDMLSSGDTDTLTITKDTTNQKIVLTAAGGGSGGDKTYHGENGIAVDNVNDTISISANFLSANALEGYATQSWVGEQGFALSSQLPTDYTTSAQVSSIVEGYNFATKAEIPTTVAELTDASNYALKSELPSDYTTSAQVSSIVESYNYITAEGIPNTYALKTDVAEASGAAVNAATGWVDAQNYLTEVPNTYALKTDIPTNDEITGLAKDYVDTLNIATTYATKDELSSKANTADVYSKTVADQTFATKTDISDMATQTWVGQQGFASASDIPTVSTYIAGEGISITSTGTNEYTISATGGGGGDKTYSAGDFISLESDTIAVTGLPEQVEYVSGWVSGMPSGGYTAGEGIDIQNGVISSTVTGVTKVSELINDVGFITSAGLTYSAGTGLELDTTTNTFSLSSAGAGENKVLSSANGSIVWADNVAGVDVDTVCGMLSSANENLTIEKSNNKILFTATGGGGSQNIIAGPGIKVSYSGNNVIISIPTETIDASSASFTFDRRLITTTETDSLSCDYSGTEPIAITTSGTIPAGITTTTSNNYIYFSATSAGITGNNSSTINVTFDAVDAPTKTVPVELKTIGFVSAIVSVTSAQFTFDASVASATSALNWTYNGSQQLNVQVIGNLPNGVTSARNGNSIEFTGDGASFSENSTNSVTVLFSADDIEQTSVQVKINITGVADPSLRVPLTFENIATDSSAVNVGLFNRGTSQSSQGTVPATYQYKKNNGEWTAYTLGTNINLTSGETVAFSGSYFNNGRNDLLVFQTSGANVLKVFGNIASLDNFNETAYSDVCTHGEARPKGQYGFLFGYGDAWSGDSNSAGQIIDISDLVINYTTAPNAMFRNTFCKCINLSGAVPSLATFTSGGQWSFGDMFKNTKLSGRVNLGNIQGNIDTSMFYGMFANTNVTEAVVGGTGFVFNQSMNIGIGWNMANMFDGCSNLSSIEVSFTEWPTSNSATKEWVKGVAGTGTFVKPSALANTTGVDNIPAGWTVVNK